MKHVFFERESDKEIDSMSLIKIEILFNDNAHHLIRICAINSWENTMRTKGEYLRSDRPLFKGNNDKLNIGLVTLVWKVTYPVWTTKVDT
jgi:hypothetical protein